MAINELIPLQARAPDLMGAASKAVNTAAGITSLLDHKKQAPKRDKLVDANLTGANLKNEQAQQELDDAKKLSKQRDVAILGELTSGMTREDIVANYDSILAAGMRQGVKFDADDFEATDQNFDVLFQAGQIHDRRTQAKVKPSAFRQKLVEAGYTPGTPEYQQAARNLLSKSGVTVNVDTGDKQDPTKPTQNHLQKSILSAEESLRNLQKITDVHSEEFLTGFGRAKAAVGDWLDKMGTDAFGLAEFNAKRVGFANEVNQFFNTYRKEITGAAASPQEMIDLKNSILNEDLGPKAFKAAVNQFYEKAEANLMANREAARSGINVGEGGAGPKPFDDLPPGVSEEDIAHTMRLHGLSREQVLSQIGAK